MKFCGQIGFAITKEEPPGVWAETVDERLYYGDIQRYNATWDYSEHLNDNFNIKNDISVLADSFLMENAGAMRYVDYLGTKWKINSINLQYPRIILTIGGVYNGNSEGEETPTPQPPEGNAWSS